jgi:tRNA pseudouridine(38-40) synthase
MKIPWNNRNSHNDFFNQRNWNFIKFYWKYIITLKSSNLPSYIKGDTYEELENSTTEDINPCLNDLNLNFQSISNPRYGLTCLKRLNNIGINREFNHKDSRYCKRQTFAIRIGYDGNSYSGYQAQNISKTKTNNNIIKSKIITVEDDLKIALGKKGYSAGRTDKGVSAVCQIVCWNTTKMNLTTRDLIIKKMKSSEPCQSGRLSIYDCQRVPKSFNSRNSATWRRYLYNFPLNSGAYPINNNNNNIFLIDNMFNGIDVDVTFINKMLCKIKNVELSYNGFSYKEEKNTGFGLKDKCIIYIAKAFVIDLSTSNSINSSSPNETQLSLCFEIIGNRFLRRMVRNIIATSIRESILLPPFKRNENLLLDICHSNDRNKSAASVPGEGLCLSGVGYSIYELAQYKFITRKEKEILSNILVKRNEFIFNNS